MNPQDLILLSQQLEQVLEQANSSELPEPSRAEVEARALQVASMKRRLHLEFPNLDEACSDQILKKQEESIDVAYQAWLTTYERLNKVIEQVRDTKEGNTTDG